MVRRILRTVGRRRGGVRRTPGAPRRPERQFVPRSAKNKMGLVMNELTTTRMFRVSNLGVTAASFSGQYYFQLNFLPQSGEFTALFDAYKIWKVDVTFIPKYNVSDFSTGGSGYGLPTMYITEDRTSGGAPASVNEIMEYSSCIARRFDRPITYTCWPQLSQTSAQGAGNIIDANTKDLWVRTDDPGVQYHGIKYALDLPVGVEVFRMDINFKYYLKFKDIK